MLLCTKWPFLWRFHAFTILLRRLIGSRFTLPLVDDTLVRGFILAPLMFGFPQSIILAYLILLPFTLLDPLQFRSNAKWLERYLVMPQISPLAPYVAKRCIDKNFRSTFRGLIKSSNLLLPDEWPDVMAWTARNFVPLFETND